MPPQVPQMRPMMGMQPVMQQPQFAPQQPNQPPANQNIQLDPFGA